jgi:hypothetical protein
MDLWFGVDLKHAKPPLVKKASAVCCVGQVEVFNKTSSKSHGRIDGLLVAKDKHHMNVV